MDSAVHVSLTGPRAAYEALNRETRLDAYEDFLGMPHELREEARRQGRNALIPAEDAEKLPPIVKPAVQRAIEAVLPTGYYVKHFTTNVELTDIDPDWRNELLAIARGRGVTNQGVAINGRPLHTWRNLRFRSKSEVRIAEALEQSNVMFLPNCMARLGVTPDYRVNREADFLVVHKGKLGILEVHGEPFHPARRAAEDHERSRLFKQHGVRLVEVYDANRCYEMPSDVVASFMRLLGGSSETRKAALHAGI